MTNTARHARHCPSRGFWLTCCWLVWLSANMRYPPEQQLFRKVIEQAIRDVTYEGCSADHVAERVETDGWFRDAGPDFTMVCDLAGLDPLAVRDRYIAGLIDRNMIERVHDRHTRNTH